MTLKADRPLRISVCPIPGFASAGRSGSAPADTISSTTARADATGQSLLEKNSVHSVWPIIVAPEPPSRSGITNSPAIGMKQSSAPATIARQRQRHRDQPERLPPWAAEIDGSLKQRLVHLLQAGIERQHHERQIRIDDTDKDRRVGRKPDQRFADQSEREQRIVQQTLALQDIHPGIDADQKGRQERQHDGRDQASAGSPAWRTGNAIRDRIADQQQDCVETAAISRLRKYDMT